MLSIVCASNVLADAIPAGCIARLEIGSLSLCQSAKGVRVAVQDLMLRALRLSQEGVRFKEWEMPVGQNCAIHLEATQLPAMLSFETVKDDGDYLARSATSTVQKPQGIHQLGLAEVARIEAQMLDVAQKPGFAHLKSPDASVKNNPALHPQSRQEN
ncbi:uncharacterized protein (DUF885 family) [Oxalobacteraceae bacterium GrIS 1.11]